MDYSRVLKYDFVHRMMDGEYDVILPEEVSISRNHSGKYDGHYP